MKKLHLQCSINERMAIVRDRQRHIKGIKRLSVKSEHAYRKRRRIRIVWTCCDACHRQHRSLFAARLHWLWLRLQHKA